MSDFFDHVINLLRKFSPINCFTVACPSWLAKRLEECGGSVSFHKYMDWAMNDPTYGFYGSGRAKIGEKGDFVTSSSFGEEFADLLGVQIADWFYQIDFKCNSNSTLSLIEFGPGECDLSINLISYFEKNHKKLLPKLQMIFIEPNEGMRQKQKKRMKDLFNIPIYWKSIEQISSSSLVGVIIAQEVLDALPVDRLVYKNNKLYQQGIELVKSSFENKISYNKLPVSSSLSSSIDQITRKYSFEIPPKDSEDGWSTEWHSSLKYWFMSCSKCMLFGTLLIIDYAMEAKRYYNARRFSGNILAYRNQIASIDLLKDPGMWDITSHLCLEILRYEADMNNWNFLGEARQGQALLALGLSKNIDKLKEISNNKLDIALNKREALLRLVDPITLGEFRWLAFEFNRESRVISRSDKLSTLFLQEP